MADFHARQFVSQIVKMGTVAASTSRYAEELCKLVRLDKAATVMEMGCGTGMLTMEVVKHLKPETTFFAVEANSDFVDQARKYCPTATIHEDRPDESKKYLQARGLEYADVIVSALPWVLFDAVLREHLLKVVDNCLAPGGQFLTVVLAHGKHSTPAKQFKRVLMQQFSKVQSSATAWSDMPMAFYYHCTK